MATKSVRLPSHVKPERYQLMLRPNLTEFTFYGEETAFLNLTKPTNKIVFHARDLVIQTARLKQGERIQAVNITDKPHDETITFTFTDPVQGPVELSLVFTGQLNDKLRGFYRSKYLHDGVEKYLATTQFESTDARAAFPCIDEPSAKAIFDVTLMTPPGTVAISNTIDTSIAEHESGYKIVQFAPTPKMSTYLLAFLVGDFEFIEGTTPEGTLVRIFTTPGKKEQAKFALDVAIRTISFYNNYFGIPYPLPVMDMIAVPDFAAGAMENWGAVTYRETALLIDPANSAAANRQRVAIVIAHELAHMWFGDLVTMEWWTHLWLNEGFASYMEYLAVDYLFPEWDIWTQFVYFDQGEALKLDSLDTTHPVEVEVHHPDEISEIFDKVSYAKGASIIRMLANYLGADTFRDGLRYYLDKHKYANARTEDLWESFEKISGQPVAKIMKNWTAKSGYPLIQIAPKGDQITLNQARFYSSTASAKASRDDTLWQIPVGMITSTDDHHQHLITKRSTALIKPTADWYKLNPGESGFFRVAYPITELKNLKTAIENNSLSPIDRLGVIRDLFDLSEAGIHKTTQALELARSYLNETDFTVWSELSSHLDQIDDLLSGTPIKERFQSYARELFSKIAPAMKWEKQPEERHTATLLRSLALANYGHYGDPDTIKQAQKLFKAWMDQGQEIDPDLRGVVYSLVAKNGGKKEYDFFKKQYLKEQNHQQKDRLGRALALFKDPTLLQQTLEFAISDDVRNQDAVFILATVVHNPDGRELAWEFLTVNWKLLQDRYAGIHFLFPRLIESFSVFNTKTQLKAVEKFFKEHPTPEAARTIAQSIEQIRSNIDWLNRDLDGITSFLKKF